MEQPTNLYSIQFVSNVTGINPHTIRAWEKRYGATKPTRDKNGRRLYTDYEIQRLDLLNQLVEIGNNISDIANLNKEQLKSVLDKYKESKNLKKKDFKEILDFNWGEHLQNILVGIRLKKIDVVCHELTNCERYMEHFAIVKNIIIPIMEELYIINKSELYDDEFYTELYLLLKSKLLKKLFQKSTTKILNQKVVVITFNGRQNELASFVVTSLFARKGYGVEHFGPNASVKQLANLCRAINPSIVFLALDYSEGKSATFDQKNNFLTYLRQSIPDVEFFVGSYNETSSFRGFEIEYINSFDLLLSILDNT